MVKINNLQKIEKQKKYKCGGMITLNLKDKWKKSIGTPLLARICADISSDGHLQIQDWRGLVSFYSKDLHAINNINKKFKHLFGIGGRIYTKKSKNVRYGIFFISKPLAIFLNEIGVPKGNKTNKPFFVSDWIINGNNKIQSAYLRGLFTGEGSIFSTKQKNKEPRWRIGIEMYKWTKYKEEGKKFMEQVKLMLNNFEIKTSPIRFGRRNKRKNGTYSIAVKLDIESREFRKFYKYVGFDDRKKTNKLLRVIAGCKP